MLPLGGESDVGEVCREGSLSEYAPRFSGHALQSLREAALRDDLSGDGDVPAQGRHRRFQFRPLHRLQGLHAGLPVRFDLHRSG